MPFAVTPGNIESPEHQPKKPEPQAAHKIAFLEGDRLQTISLRTSSAVSVHRQLFNAAKASIGSI